MRAGTITAAARMLNISQPALSQFLLHAEDDLGFALFERTRGRLAPTPEALELFPDVERLMEGQEGLRRKAIDLRLGRAGLVRVASSAPSSATVLPSAFCAFRKAHPAVRLRSHMASIQAVVRMLRDGDASLGLAMDDRLAPDIAVEVLGEVAFLCLMPEDHPLAARQEVGFADLQGETLMTYRRNTRPGDDLVSHAEASGAPIDPQIEFDVSLSAFALVQAGLGIAVVDALFPWKQFSGLVTRRLSGSPLLPLSLLTLSTRALSLAEEMMRDAIRAAAREHFAERGR